ncbi:type IV pilus biogenesis protein PilP [Donghicola sp. XS_ASV15]|uniref:type IV pilus biogenesis protein PilP n=1 Tax=Donghicola sp. XS_ASV15 TaxID=3241295 RepID=UPI00351219F9
MITNFALSLTFNGISLLQRADNGWLLVGEISLDTPDLSDALAELREKALQLAPEGVFCKIIIPDEQIRYLTLSGVPAGAERSSARIALEGATPYRVEQLNFDCIRLPDGTVSVAAVAHDTLDEAEGFAIEHGFMPYSFAAIPAPEANYPAEPYLGTSLHAREVMPKGEEVHRDSALITVTGVAKIKIDRIGTVDDKIPLPDFEAKDETNPFSEMVTATKAREDAAEAPFVEVTTPEEPAEITPDQSAATLTAERTVPNAPPKKSANALKAERKDVAPGVFTMIGGMLASSKLPLPRNQEPAKLGMLATAAVVLLMGVVGATATLLTGSEPQDIAGTEPVAIPITTVPDTDLDLAELENEPEASAPIKDQPTTPAPSSEEVDETFAMLGEAEDLLPRRPVAPESAPPAVVEISPEDLAALYEREGIYAIAPTAPAPPQTAEEHDAFVPSKDQTVPSLDAVSLPSPSALANDELPPRQSLPTAPEHEFTLDENGLVEPTPEGTLAPGGYRVFLGTPPVVPPARPDLTPEVDPEGEEQVADAGTTEESAEAEPEYKLRPSARPDDLAEKIERARFGGRTMAEMAMSRPQARPADLAPEAQLASASPETATAVMDALREASGGSTAGLSQPVEQDAVNAAVDDALATASLVPKARPQDFGKITESTKPAPQQQQVASAAPRKSVQPSIPSKASVSKAATESNVLALRKLNLIGVYGSDSSRRALLRLPNGRYKKVKVGDRIDGSKVTAISADAIRLVKGGRNIVLEMPKG